MPEGNTTNVTVTLEVEISRERIADLLCCAMEGGIGYWGTIIEFIEPPEGASLSIGGHWDEASAILGEDKPPIYRHIHYPMCGGAVVLADTEFEDPEDEDAAFKPVKLDWEALQRGLSVMSKKYPRHFSDFLQENEDATTGDVFVQCAALGETVFG